MNPFVPAASRTPRQDWNHSRTTNKNLQCLPAKDYNNDSHDKRSRHTQLPAKDWQPRRHQTQQDLDGQAATADRAPGLARAVGEEAMKSKEERTETKRRERGTGRLYQRHEGGVWWAAYSVRGKRIRVSTHETDEKKANKFLKQRTAEVLTRTHKDVGNLKYEILRDALLQDYRTNLRKSLHEGKDEDGKIVYYLDAVTRLDEFFKNYKVIEIGTDEVRKFQDSLRARGLAPATINRSVSSLRRMFSLARKEGRLLSSPYFPMLKEGPPRAGFVERGDYDALFKVLPSYLRLPLAFGFFTGMRREEILGLRWEQVDLIENVITLIGEETKNGTGRVIPITPTLRSLILEQRAKSQPECHFVCSRIDKLGHAQRIGNFRKSWQSACIRAGLGTMKPADGTVLRADRPRGAPKPKMVFIGTLFHDLRRSAVRNMVRSKVSEKIAMTISGHKTRAVFDRYNITSTEDVLEAGRKLESYLVEEEKEGHRKGHTLHQNGADSKLIQ
jgi:integrase